MEIRIQLEARVGKAVAILVREGHLERMLTPQQGHRLHLTANARQGNPQLRLARHTVLLQS